MCFLFVCFFFSFEDLFVFSLFLLFARAVIFCVFRLRGFSLLNFFFFCGGGGRREEKRRERCEEKSERMRRRKKIEE